MSLFLYELSSHFRHSKVQSYKKLHYVLAVLLFKTPTDIFNIYLSQLT